MELDDPRWPQLLGGYRLQYDPRPALRLLETGEDDERSWEELWENLHHQGDVGEASYAAIPHLVRIHRLRAVPDWNTYAMVAVIDDARRRGKTNPPLPEFLASVYAAAIVALADIGCRELPGAKVPELVSGILSVIALHKGHFGLASLALEFNESEREALLAMADSL